MAGRFITLEGGEGAGKSTLTHALAAAITAAGKRVVVTREPGGTTGADEIRKLIVTGAADRWSALTETLLFMAARRDHIERVIRPALARGDWVLCDRYVDSTRAYQAAAGGVAAETVEALAGIIEAPTPDLTLVLDLDPATGVARAGGRSVGEPRFEALAADFHKRVRGAFREIAAREPERCLVLDASAPAPAVLAAARAAVAQRLGLAV
jgi:dTMP kinase